MRTHYVQRVLEDLDPGARRIARLNRRLHHSPLAVPLGLGTRVIGAQPDLTTALRELADARTPIVETWVVVDAVTAVDDEPLLVDEPLVDQALVDEPLVDEPLVDEAQEARPTRRLPDPRPAIALLIGRVAARFERPPSSQGDLVDESDEHDDAGDETDQAEASYAATEIVASATPPPAREAVVAARAEVRHESRADLDDGFGEDTQVWGMLHVVPEIDEPLVLADDPAHDPDGPVELPADPVIDPVIGPQLAAARMRLGLTVDELADRTRIRPHVIEAIEVDDFAACGGDFYARGHLRTLGRVLGVEVDAAAGDVRRAVRRRADRPAGRLRGRAGRSGLAPGHPWRAQLVGPGRGGDGAGPVLVGGAAGDRGLRTEPRPGRAERVRRSEPQPLGADQAGPDRAHRRRRRRPGGGARRSREAGLRRRPGLRAEAHRQASPPVRIQSTDGSVQVTVDGQDRGRMGPAGRPASKRYVEAG